MNGSGAQDALCRVRHASKTCAVSFTTVRDVGNVCAFGVCDLCDAIADGFVEEPRMLCAGAYVTYPRSEMSSPISRSISRCRSIVASVTQARRMKWVRWFAALRRGMPISSRLSQSARFTRLARTGVQRTILKPRSPWPSKRRVATGCSSPPTPLVKSARYERGGHDGARHTLGRYRDPCDARRGHLLRPITYLLKWIENEAVGNPEGIGRKAALVGDILR